MKKVLSTLIFSVILLSLFGCEKKTENPDSYDFNSETFTIVCDENNSEDVFYFTEDSIYAEELRQRISEIENEYNCKIELRNDETDAESYVNSKIASNSNGDIDILLSMTYYLRRWAASGYLYDVNDYSEIIDYTDGFRWGEKNDLETCAVNGNLFGLIPSCWPDNLKSFFYVIVANNSLMKDAGYQDIRTYQENGKFTREFFEEVIKTAYQPEKGIYSLDTGLEAFITPCVYANGGTVYNSETKKTGLRNKGVVDAVSWGQRILNTYKSQIYLHDDYRDKFLSGNAVMATCDSSGLIKGIASNENVGEFTVFPFPKGPEASKSTSSGYIHSYAHAISIPKIADDVEASAIIVDELFKPFSSMQTEEQLDYYYKNNIFWDDRDYEILKEESKNAEYNYWQEGFHDLMTVIARSSTSISPAAAVEASISAADNIVDLKIAKNKEGFELYFEK